jgi:hypothetical protein
VYFVILIFFVCVCFFLRACAFAYYLVRFVVLKTSLSGVLRCMVAACGRGAGGRGAFWFFCWLLGYVGGWGGGEVGQRRE